jgi:phosphatidylethanolamine-binding protein (PEBP) family uncharacterized protein
LRRLPVSVLSSSAAIDQNVALTGSDLKEGDTIVNEHKGCGCARGDVSPALNWSGAPSGTKSFAVFDPDALTDSGWWHRFVFDIPLGIAGSLNNCRSQDGWTDKRKRNPSSCNRRIDG